MAFTACPAVDLLSDPEVSQSLAPQDSSTSTRIGEFSTASKIASDMALLVRSRRCSQTCDCCVWWYRHEVTFAAERDISSSMAQRFQEAKSRSDLWIASLKEQLQQEADKGRQVSQVCVNYSTISKHVQQIHPPMSQTELSGGHHRQDCLIDIKAVASALA